VVTNWFKDILKSGMSMIDIEKKKTFASLSSWIHYYYGFIEGRTK
jgi:hypothetical protein